MLKKRKIKKNLNITIPNILILLFVVLFFNTLAISENTTLILDFINLSILSFIVFFLILNFNLNCMFIASCTNYNSIRMLWTVKLISRITYGNIL